MDKQYNIRNMSVIAHVDHGVPFTVHMHIKKLFTVDLIHPPVLLAFHVEPCAEDYPSDRLGAHFLFMPVGKSTLTDSLVAAAGIIAMENVSSCPNLTAYALGDTPLNCQAA